jgi:hypothetical protein
MSSKRSSLLVKNILEAIPFDDWVSSSDISRRTGIRPQSVGIIISNSLLVVHVERKKEGKSKIFVYRRLHKLKRKSKVVMRPILR